MPHAQNKWEGGDPLLRTQELLTTHTDFGWSSRIDEHGGELWRAGHNLPNDVPVSVIKIVDPHRKWTEYESLWLKNQAVIDFRKAALEYFAHFPEDHKMLGQWISAAARLVMSEDAITLGDVRTILAANEDTLDNIPGFHGAGPTILMRIFNSEEPIVQEEQDEQTGVRRTISPAEEEPVGVEARVDIQIND